MKAKLITLIAFILFAITSCKQEPNIGELNQSYNQWNQFKKDVNNSYRYSVNSSSFSGSSSETIIYVREGKVVMRYFKSTISNGGNPPILTITEEWTEDQGSLNTHQKGAPTKTIDEIYDQAKNDWLKKRDGVKTYFENKNFGMISLAGYVKDGCQDDCFIGVNIGFIEKITY